MFRVFQAHIGPSFATIDRFINTVAIADTALAVVLAGANPNYIRIFWIKNDATDGIGTFVIENRCPGDTRVFGFPNPAASDGDIKFGPVFWVNSETHNAARHERRPDGAELQAGEWVRLGSSFGCLEKRQGK